MQQQQPRRTSDATLVPSKSESHAEVQALHGEPVELDLEQLRHVSGGETVPAPPAPKRFW